MSNLPTTPFTPNTSHRCVPPAPPATPVTGALAGTPTAHPHVGGILPDGGPGEPWTGGSNINPLPLPSYLMQHHPWKYASLKAFLGELEKGSTDKLGLNNEKSDCSFQLWLKQQHQAHIEFGLDTVFKMPNPLWTSETDLFKDFTITLEKVCPWINQLLNGVSQQTPNGVLHL